MEPITAKGHTGTVTFDGQFVTISRRSFAARATVGKGEKRIPVASITAVQWKQPGALVNGFIQFTIAGGVERRSGFGSQTTDAVADENSVVVTKKQGPAFEALRAVVEQAIAAQQVPSVAAPAGGGVAEQIQQLASLHEQGILTDEEYAQKKAELLGRM